MVRPNYNPEEVKKYITYLWSQGMVDMLAEKVANEGIDDQHIDHVEAEEQMELERERERDRKQFEMFNVPDWNWSGLR